MVKREAGFNAATHDWEFFELDVSQSGTSIRKRGRRAHRGGEAGPGGAPGGRGKARDAGYSLAIA
jgi:hypothetical protein